MTTGRVRIKIPSRKGDLAFFAALKDKLPGSAEILGIQRIEMNPTTGSVLVVHHADFKAPELAVISGYLEQMGLVKLEPIDASKNPVSRNIAKTFQNMNQQITDFTSGEIDLQSMALLGLLGLGLFQISRGQFMIPAISAFWYAATLLKDQPVQKNVQEQKIDNPEV
ncbi:MAG TPA: hypothetical protein VLY20_04260 [Nitrospiria bacterium]|nr:hypothetical protein [Nitrospiria bacterium]